VLGQSTCGNKAFYYLTLYKNLSIWLFSTQFNHVCNKCLCEKLHIKNILSKQQDVLNVITEPMNINDHEACLLGFYAVCCVAIDV